MSLKVSVVFYMHVPFPTSQIFRSLPAANELLQSMTCADVVGFHAFDHVRHFLNAAKVETESDCTSHSFRPLPHNPHTTPHHTTRSACWAFGPAPAKAAAA